MGFIGQRAEMFGKVVVVMCVVFIILANVFATRTRRSRGSHHDEADDDAHSRADAAATSLESVTSEEGTSPLMVVPEPPGGATLMGVTLPQYPPCYRPGLDNATVLRCEMVVLDNVTWGHVMQKKGRKTKRWNAVLSAQQLRVVRKTAEGTNAVERYINPEHVGPFAMKRFFRTNKDFDPPIDFIKSRTVHYRHKSNFNFKYGVVLPEVQCIANLWHGILETVLPVHDLLVRTGLVGAAERGEVLFLLNWPRVNGWANTNIGCRSRNRFPFGIKYAHYVGRYMFEVMGVAPNATYVPGQLLDGHVTTFGDMQHIATQIHPFNHIINVAKLVIGMPKTCTPGEVFAARGQRWLAWPFYGLGSNHEEAEYCSKLLLSLRQLALRRRGIVTTNDDSSRDRRVTLEERLCPRIVFIKRDLNKNGRGIVNEPALLDRLRAQLRRRCPSGKFTIEHVRLEKLPIDDQMRLMLNTTILIAGRGAGMVNSLYLRRGAGMFSMSIADRGRPVEADQFPFYPFISFVTGQHIGFTNCDAILVEERRHPCHAVTVNFCDMRCNLTRIDEAFGRFHEKMIAAASSEGTQKEGTLYDPEPVCPRVRAGPRGQHFFTGLD